ncbi:ATPase family AAA domain-containing protein 2 isoform X4 [Parasteatoda tepidariorum]|uniref:ATPase family AAA domain-containing protein 2 isoform X4 n=1 Tax=Parasteatoda tepidariorum TaxID=114398 RepID=UPI0039BD09D7
MRLMAETETDDSSTNSSSRQRKLSGKVVAHLQKYDRNGLPKISHLPHSLKRELETSRDTDQKSSVATISSHSNSNEMFVNGTDSIDDKQNVRRSTRQRKFMYDNLNQAWLLASSIPEFTKYEPLFPTVQRSPQDDQCETVRPRRSLRNHNELQRLGLTPEGLEYEDMYSRVKRKKRKTVHTFFSRRISRGDGCMADTEDTDQNGISDSDTIDDRSDIENSMQSAPQFPTEMDGGQNQDGVAHVPSNVVRGPKYSLRPKKPITERFQVSREPTRPRRSTTTIFEANQHHPRPPRERDSFKIKTTAHRNHIYTRKRHAIHNSSSSSSDEGHFEKRKAISLARARNRCLPLNFLDDDLTKGTIRDRVMIGSSLADIDPMGIDKTVSFDHVGGLDKHIRSLKEMILFPLMYPEVFQRFKIAPPRGVLFYGQPGTGKTLVARALANECSTGDKRVAFFMRKGADCLSKWVGESERQLRLLFDQAYTMRPAIIFFDEIDGLAPVRSTRQDQIHSSIVSTLLALMDGLDNRGEIVIIGATNRLDAIDPALRRPGRFDRELLFPLPSYQAREKILKIITKEWIPPQPDSLISELAACTAGYCGADLKALCSEAALVALRRRYPQIYESKQKLQLDVETIHVDSVDFLTALKKMKPSVQRSSVFSSKPLSTVVKPLLEPTLLAVVQKISKIFPYFTFPMKKQPSLPSICSENSTSKLIDSEDSDSYMCSDDVPKLTSCLGSPRSRMKLLEVKSNLTSMAPILHRPYFLISGKEGQGQGSLAPAVLHLLENVTVHRLDIPALYAVTTRAPEEACAQIFHEAQRNVPSVIFLPHIGYWWETLSETVRATFLSLLQDLDPSLPLMLFATSDVTYYQLPIKIQEIFSASTEQVFSMRTPTLEERKTFFASLVKEIFKLPQKSAEKSKPEELPLAPPPVIHKLTDNELQRLREKEEATLRELRLFLRDIVTKLARDRRFSVFSRPVDPEEVPDYQEVIKHPMDLETMMTKIDTHRYETVAQFLSDIDLLCQNALEYNPDRDPSDKLIRHRACALKDMAHALVLSELDAEFEKICQAIHASRKERGENPPSFPSPSKRLTSSRLTMSASNVASTFKNEANKVYDNHVNSCEKSSEKKENGETLSSPTRFSKRLREQGTSSQTTEHPVTKPHSPPKRASRYVIWRKRKRSPWYGGCKQKLIRRKVVRNDPSKKSKYFSNAKFIKTSDPLQPTQEELDPTAEPSASSSMEVVISKSVEDRRDMSGTDSSATVVSPKTIAMYNDADKEDNTADGKTSNPASPSKRHLSCDISNESNCSNSVFFHSPPSSSMHISPSKRKSTMSPESPHFTRSQGSLDPTTSSVRQKVLIDTAALDAFISHLVRITEDYTVEKLLQLYSVLQQCVYKHRKQLDKKELLKELERNLESFLRYKPS